MLVWVGIRGLSAYRIGRLRTTPPQAATNKLLLYLPNGHQVVLPNVGHITSFFAEQPQAGSHLINTFLAIGKVDRSLYQPQPVVFTADTSAPATAKKILGLMLAMAALTVLSCSRWRSGYGTADVSGAPRACWSAPWAPWSFGLGGWFLALLVALATMPGVSLDNQLVAVVATGIPAGLAVALAWVDRTWPARTKVIGFASAMAGALIGAWLAFHATDGLLVLLTPVIGSVVGANLALIAFDTGRDRQAGLVPPVPRQGGGRRNEASMGQPDSVGGRSATRSPTWGRSG